MSTPPSPRYHHRLNGSGGNSGPTSSSSLTSQVNQQVWCGRFEWAIDLSFDCALTAVSTKDAYKAGRELPPTLVYRGTSWSNQVWPYIGQLKDTLNKEIILLLVQQPQDPQCYRNYLECYTKIKRCVLAEKIAVLRAPEEGQIRDAYAFTLDPGESLPDILRSLEGPGLPDWCNYSGCIVLMLVRRMDNEDQKVLRRKLLEQSWRSMKTPVQIPLEPVEELQPEQQQSIPIDMGTLVITDELEEGECIDEEEEEEKEAEKQFVEQHHVERERRCLPISAPTRVASRQPETQQQKHRQEQQRLGRWKQQKALVDNHEQVSMDIETEPEGQQQQEMPASTSSTSASQMTARRHSQQQQAEEDDAELLRQQLLNSMKKQTKKKKATPTKHADDETPRSRKDSLEKQKRQQKQKTPVEATKEPRQAILPPPPPPPPPPQQQQLCPVENGDALVDITPSTSTSTTAAAAIGGSEQQNLASLLEQLERVQKEHAAVAHRKREIQLSLAACDVELETKHGLMNSLLARIVASCNNPASMTAAVKPENLVKPEEKKPLEKEEKAAGKQNPLKRTRRTEEEEEDKMSNRPSKEDEDISSPLRKRGRSKHSRKETTSRHTFHQHTSHQQPGTSSSSAAPRVPPNTPAAAAIVNELSRSSKEMPTKSPTEALKTAFQSRELSLQQNEEAAAAKSQKSAVKISQNQTIALDAVHQQREEEHSSETSRRKNAPEEMRKSSNELRKSSSTDVAGRTPTPVELAEESQRDAPHQKRKTPEKTTPEGLGRGRREMREETRNAPPEGRMEEVSPGKENVPALELDVSPSTQQTILEQNGLLDEEMSGHLMEEEELLRLEEEAMEEGEEELEDGQILDEEEDEFFAAGGDGAMTPAMEGIADEERTGREQWRQLEVGDIEAAGQHNFVMVDPCLMSIRSYRLCAGFPRKLIAHPAVSNRLHPFIPLCPFQLHGRCADRECGFQHEEEYLLSEREIVEQIIDYWPRVCPRGVQPDEYAANLLAKGPVDLVVGFLIAKMPDEVRQIHFDEDDNNTALASPIWINKPVPKDDHIEYAQIAKKALTLKGDTSVLFIDDNSSG